MTRGQRRMHAALWPILVLVLAGVIGTGLYERARVAEAAAVDPEAG